jgi:quinolinate synthase
MDTVEARVPDTRSRSHAPGPRGPVAPLPAFTPELAAEMAPVYARVKHVVTPMEWPHYAPLIKAINDLKKTRNAVILAHNYMTPEIFHCVGDFRGDSLQLAKEAARTEANVIVQAGVHFMAETSKLLNPDKTVLIPDLEAGCSLAASITAEDVRMLREVYPGVPIVTYVNTSAAVKAECDITCTSSNAVKVVESLGAPRGRAHGQPHQLMHRRRERAGVTFHPLRECRWHKNSSPPAQRLSALPATNGSVRRATSLSSARAWRACSRR